MATRLKTFELNDVTVRIIDEDTDASYDLLTNSSSETISITDPLENIVVTGGERRDIGTIIQSGRTTELVVEHTHKSIDDTIENYLKDAMNNKKRISLIIEGKASQSYIAKKYDFTNGTVKKRPLQSTIGDSSIDGAYVLSYGFPSTEENIKYTQI